MNKDYRSAALREFRDQQVRYAPREKKAEQADRAETLLAEIKDDQIYAYEYLALRLTDIRPTERSEEKLVGKQVRHDLRLLIEDLTDAADMPVEAAGETVHSIGDLSKRFQVSTKTISRWRKQGLVGRRFLFDGRKRIGFLDSSVRRFVGTNPEKVERGARFSQMSEDERQTIIERARRLAIVGGRPTEVARRVASHVGRSVETVRYTLKQFDQENPDIAVFPDPSGALSAEVKTRLYREFRRGDPVEDLAKRYHRTKGSIYRIVGEVRAERIMDLSLDYIDSEEFVEIRTPRREAEALGPAPVASEPQRAQRLPAGLPAYLAQLYDIPLLTREQEQHLFRKMNYLKYKASRLRDQLDPSKPKQSLMNQIEELYDAAVKTKNEIVSANLRLVVSIAKRHVSQTDNFFELVSDGNVSLMRAVEKFNYSLGNKFSTYASWAIIKNYARSIPNEIKHRDRFRTTAGEMFESTVDLRSDEYEQESRQMERESQVEKILGHLDEREQLIIVSRFGLQPGTHPQTLKEVGKEMGVTKERIRQIEARALNKLRDAAAEERIEIPGL